MENEELVSIIVPMFNCENTISRLIRCLQAQTYQNIEILLINDGSGDNTEAVCKKCAGADSRFKLITKINGGVSSARNCGLKASQGKWILFVDADDTVNEAYIKELMEQTGQANLVLGIMKTLSKDGNEVTVFKEDKTIIRDVETILLNCWSVCGKLYCKEDIKDLWFNENVRIAEDLKFTVDYLCQTSVIGAFANRAVYSYRIDGESAMRSGYGKGFYTGFITEIRCYEKLIKKGINADRTVLIGNGAYQMLTRYFEQGKNERKRCRGDYISARKMIKKYRMVIMRGGLGKRKKLFIALSCHFPAPVLFYKSLKKYMRGK